MSRVLFEEHQRFRQVWLWAIVLIGLAAGVIAAIAALRNSRSVVEALAPMTIGLTIGIGVVLLLLILRLTVRVETGQVLIHFFPLSRKTIAIDQIVSCAARTYRPILEYGGWGVRYSFRGGWAYNVAGNRGVQLELADGKKILIGSQRADEFAAAIARAKAAPTQPE